MRGIMEGAMALSVLSNGSICLISYYGLRCEPAIFHVPFEEAVATEGIPLGAFQMLSYLRMSSCNIWLQALRVDETSLAHRDDSSVELWLVTIDSLLQPSTGSARLSTSSSWLTR